MLKFSKTTLVALTIAACASFSANAADAAAGKAKAEQACAACHAKEGNWSAPIDPSYPKLAGQHKDYIVQALLQYKDGRRKNGIMAAQSANLSNDDMSNLAAYLASLPTELTTKK